MKKNRIDSFTCFVGFLLILALFFSIKLFAGIQDGKKQYLALVSLGDLTYDDDFLKKAKKIEGIKEIWPVVEIPVTIKIEDYTETATFLGIDLNAFGENPEQNDLGNTPVLLLGSKALQNMKDSNNHSISKKQQEKFLEMGENLNIFYSLDEKEKDTSKATDDLTTLSSNSADHPVSLTGHEENEQQIVYLPCKVTAVTENEEIYIPLSQAQELCSEMGEPLKITKIYLKVNGKMNLEKAKKLFE